MRLQTNKNEIEKYLNTNNIVARLIAKDRVILISKEELSDKKQEVITRLAHPYRVDFFTEKEYDNCHQ